MKGTKHSKGPQGQNRHRNSAWHELGVDLLNMVIETNLHAVKWYNKHSVSLLSNYTGEHPVTEVDKVG